MLAKSTNKIQFYQWSVETPIKILYIRSHKKPLDFFPIKYYHSLLRTFVHDPLVEWSSERTHNNSEKNVVLKEKALHIVNSISRKLRGLHARNKQLLPLSVEGDVQRTIQVCLEILIWSICTFTLVKIKIQGSVMNIVL